MTFYLSILPNSATIEGAKLHYLTDADWNRGNPFDDMGALHVYHHDYGYLTEDRLRNVGFRIARAFETK